MTEKFVSYAQNFEDVMLNRVFSDLKTGFYIDIGACDPMIDSVTHAFYLKGWSGINIEPTARFYELLVKQRPRDTNLQLAVSDKNKILEFVTVQDAGISSVDTSVLAKASELGYAAQTSKIQAITLEKLTQDYCQTKEIHFLKIDVEGHEQQVIEGADWTQFRPWILIVEAVADVSAQHAATPAWHQNLCDAGYLFAWFDGLNRFYVRQESSELLRHFDRPVNIFDHIKLSKNHAWSYSPSFARRILSQLLPAQVKATLRSLASNIFGARLR